jgi:predicted cation transporter
MTAAALIVILVAVLIGPLLIESIEHHLDLFFLATGILAALVSGQFGWRLIREAAAAPIALTTAVLIFDAILIVIRQPLDRSFKALQRRMPARWICFGMIIVLGLLAGVITAVVAALVFVELIELLQLGRASEIAITVLACFAIGLGSALTPAGGPLSALAIANLHADFWYLARMLSPMVAAAILIVAAISLAIPLDRSPGPRIDLAERGWRIVILRATKVYVFVAGLVGLSSAMRPLVDRYVRDLPVAVLFWLNSISAVVDNAALTAAEIGPALSHSRQRAILMGLLISGGMLIPGNIPNIVAANRLRIGSREWARVGLIVGLPLMLLCFAVLELLLPTN